MAGRAAARQAAHEFATFQAWQFARISRAEKLRPLKHYLDELKPRAPSSGSEIVAGFKAMAAAGLPVTIERVVLEPDEG